MAGAFFSRHDHVFQERLIAKNRLEYRQERFGNDQAPARGYRAA